MKLTEAEMRMVFQIESTNQNAALNEIYMTWRYAPNPATKETAEGLLDKLRPLSDQECMDLIRKVQAEYRLPEKARTIGEMLAEARQRSGAQKLSGHDIMALERFDPATRHMIVFDVLTHDSPVGWKGEKMRLFLTDTGYSKALENQEKGHIKIRGKSSVSSSVACVLNRAWMFSHAGGYGGIQTGKPLKINTFYFHRKEVRRWLFFVLKRPVIIRSCRTIT